MSPLLYYNPSSGRGRARRLAEALSWQLRHAGFDPRLVACTEGRAALAHALQHSASTPALIIVGGDGTLHHALPEAIAHAAPIYHVPAGSENLFARALQTTASAQHLIAALRAARPDALESIDVIEATGLADAHAHEPPTPRLAALMLSIGPDASLVARVEARRARRAWASSGHAGFALSAIREAWSPCLPALHLRLDGREIVPASPAHPSAPPNRGQLLIASARPYALRIDPARRADLRDGLLDVVFMPARSTFASAAWLIRARLGTHLDHAGLIYQHARAIEISSPDPRPLPVQLDGEPATLPAGATLRVRVLPKALHVLVGVSSGGLIPDP